VIYFPDKNTKTINELVESGPVLINFVIGTWCPRMPRKSITKRQEIEYHMQDTHAHPFFEGHGIGSNFVWKDSLYAFQGGSSKYFRSSGADYLFTYWMNKLGNLFGNEATHTILLQ
jgi:hypothetical protein